MRNSRDPEIGRALAIFKGFDSGDHDLPQEVLAARRVFEHAGEELAEVSRAALAIDPGAKQRELTEQVLASLRNGRLEGDWVQPLFDLKDEQVRLGLKRTILEQAEEVAANRLPTVIRAHADEILADFLRPVLVARLEELRAIHKKVDFRKVPFGREADLARADKAVREAHARVRELEADYAFLRGQQNTLRVITGSPSEDAFARFREFANPYDRDMFPLLGAWNAPPAPWDSMPGGKVVWIVLNPQAQVWMPTAEECDAAYDSRVTDKAFLANKTTATEGVFVRQV
jgi:hypothetical protein